MIAIKCRVVNGEWEPCDAEILTPREAAEACAADHWAGECDETIQRVEVLDDHGALTTWTVVPVVAFEAMLEEST